MGSLAIKESGSTAGQHSCAAAPHLPATSPCHLHGFPPAATDADGLTSPFSFYYSRTRISPEFYNSCSFMGVFYSKIAKCKRNCSSLCMSLYSAFKKIKSLLKIYTLNAVRSRQLRAAGLADDLKSST